MKKQDLKNRLLEFKEDDFLNPKENKFDTGNLLLNSALHYASLGCRVIPLHSVSRVGNKLVCSCSNSEDCTKQGKHPRTWKGLKDGSSDSEQIRKWWKGYPTANIGLLTGKASGFFVLDIDLKYGGEYSLRYLEEKYEDLMGENYTSLRGTLQAETGLGGRHIFFKYPSDVLLYGSVSEIGAGLDIRAEGNYVVAAPSGHISGGKYSWFGTDTPLHEAPNWLVIEILSTREAAVSPSGKVTKSTSFTGKIKDGKGRHEHFWKYVCGLINNRTEEEVLELAHRYNQERLDPPKESGYVEKQVKYLYKKYTEEGKNMGLKR